MAPHRRRHARRANVGHIVLQQVVKVDVVCQPLNEGLQLRPAIRRLRVLLWGGRATQRPVTGARRRAADSDAAMELDDAALDSDCQSM